MEEDNGNEEDTGEGCATAANASLFVYWSSTTLRKNIGGGGGGENEEIVVVGMTFLIGGTEEFVFSHFGLNSRGGGGAGGWSKIASASPHLAFPIVITFPLQKKRSRGMHSDGDEMRKKNNNLQYDKYLS